MVSQVIGLICLNYRPVALLNVCMTSILDFNLEYSLTLANYGVRQLGIFAVQVPSRRLGSHRQTSMWTL